MPKHSIEDSLWETITDPSINITFDLTEIIVDKVLDEGVLRDLPIVNAIKSIVEAGFSIRDRLFLRKLFLFMKSSSVDRNSFKYIKFMDKIKKDNMKNELTQYLIELIDKTTDQIKIPIFSKLFDSIIEKELNWSEFYYLSICLNNLHPLGIDFIREIMAKKNVSENINISRDNRESFLLSAGLTSRNGGQMCLNDYGKKLYEYCLS